jgi:hypothetical protein
MVQPPVVPGHLDLIPQYPESMLTRGTPKSPFATCDSHRINVALLKGLVMHQRIRVKSDHIRQVGASP